MSSSHDAGYYADKASKEMEAPCPSKKAKKGKHKWKKFGSYPSTWHRCQHCGTEVYSK